MRPPRRRGIGKLFSLFRDWKFVLLTIAAAVLLALTFMNVSARNELRLRQSEVLTRQQFINETAALGRLNAQLVQALATLSANNDDDAIREMLAKHGVTFKVNTKTDATAAKESAP